MTTTPWGPAAALRSRRLRPGPGVPRAEVERNQRERLYGAMVAAVADNGYADTRVADLVAISGVSRNTFYRLFANKQDCFVGALDAFAAVGTQTVADIQRDAAAERWDERLERSFEALARLIAGQPAAARLYYVESYAAGPQAIARIERAGDELLTIARAALAQSPDHADVPEDLLRAVLRGIRRIIQSRLRSGRADALVDEASELLRWALGYTTPPQPLRRPAGPPRDDFAPHPRGRGASARIQNAVVELLAEKGYEATTIGDIASRASISLTTFYAHYSGKEDAVVVAMRRAANEVLDTVTPAYRDAPDWPRAIAAALDAFLAFLVVRRPFAQFGGIDVLAGSRLIVEVRGQLLSAAAAFLGEGYRQHPHTSPLAAEAIGATIDALLFDQLRRHGPDRVYEAVTTATYVALVPFVGAEHACAVANERR